jgi:hypothetical protein
MGFDSLSGRAAVHRSWANTTDRAARTAPAGAAQARQREHQVDPDGLLSPKARSQAAGHLRLAGLAATTAKAKAKAASKAAHPAARRTVG